MPISASSPILSSPQASKSPSCASLPLQSPAKPNRGAGTPAEIKPPQTMQNKAAVAAIGNSDVSPMKEVRKPLQESNTGVNTPQNLASATRSGRRRNVSTASISSCGKNLSGRRRKVEEDDISTNSGTPARKMSFAGTDAASQGESVTSKPLSREHGNVLSPQTEVGFSSRLRESSHSSDGGDASHPSDPKHLQVFSLPRHETSSSNNSTPEQLYSPAEDDSNSSQFPESEEVAASPSPEMSGNWRLNAVLESFGYLSPTREGRVKTLVRAFESLLSVTERREEHQERKMQGHSLKFSYLNSNKQGLEDSHRKEFLDGASGESEREGASPGEDNLSERYAENEDYGWQTLSAEPVYTESLAENAENDDQRARSREEAVIVGKGQNGKAKISQTQKTQELDERENYRVNKRRQGYEDERHCSLTVEQCGVEEKKESGTEVQLQDLDDKKENQPDEQVPTGVQQPLHIVSAVTSRTEAKEERSLRGLEVGQTPLCSVQEAASERQLPNKKIRINLQQKSSQKATVGLISSAPVRTHQNIETRGAVRVSNRSLLSKRPPLHQKSHVHPVQAKPRLSKPQPFNLLTEARGYVKEEEFLMRLRKIMEEEERLRIPLAQGLPWTTDEPEIPQKPPVKESTKPLDIHLYSDLRAMERAEFDQFIAEKLLYIEERRLEEENRRRAAEEEEVKRMRQEMVPKAQLMPYFDRPFRPRRSSKRPTIPKEPQFHLHKQQPKRQKCVAGLT